MKTVTVARLLVTRTATAVCCCCRRGYACRYDCLCFLVTILDSCYKNQHDIVYQDFFSVYRPVFIVSYYIRFVNYSIHFDVLFIFVDWDYTLHSDFFSRLFTHAGCVAAGVGRAFSRVCLSVCLYVSLHSKRKRLELSAPKSIDI